MTLLSRLEFDTLKDYLNELIYPQNRFLNLKEFESQLNQAYDVVITFLDNVLLYSYCTEAKTLESLPSHHKTQNTQQFYKIQQQFKIIHNFALNPENLTKLESAFDGCFRKFVHEIKTTEQDTFSSSVKAYHNQKTPESPEVKQLLSRLNFSPRFNQTDPRLNSNTKIHQRISLPPFTPGSTKKNPPTKKQSDSIIKNYKTNLALSSDESTQGEFEILKKQLDGLKKEIQEQKLHNQALDEQIQHLEDKILALEEKEDCQKEIETLQHQAEEKVDLQTMADELSEVFAGGLFERLTKISEDLGVTENQTSSASSSSSSSNTPRAAKTKPASTPFTPVTSSQVVETHETTKSKDFHTLIQQSILLIKNLEQKNKIKSKKQYLILIQEYKTAINDALLLIKKQNDKNHDANHIENQEVIDVIQDYFFEYVLEKYQITLNKDNINSLDLSAQNNPDAQKFILDFYTHETLSELGILNPALIFSKNNQHLPKKIKEFCNNKIKTELNKIKPKLQKFMLIYSEDKASLLNGFTEFFKEIFRNENNEEHRRTRLNDADKLKKIIEKENFIDIHNIIKTLGDLNRSIYGQNPKRNPDSITTRTSDRKIKAKDSGFKFYVSNNIRNINKILDRHSAYINPLLSNSTQREDLYFEMHCYANENIATMIEGLYDHIANAWPSRIKAFFDSSSKDSIRIQRIDKLRELSNKLIESKSKNDYLCLLSDILSEITRSLQPDLLSHHCDEIYRNCLVKLSLSIINEHVINPIKKNRVSLNFNLSELETIKQLLPSTAGFETDTLKTAEKSLDDIIHTKQTSDIYNASQLLANTKTNSTTSTTNTKSDNFDQVEYFKSLLKDKMDAQILAEMIKSTGQFALSPTELSNIFTVISSVAEHIPFLHTISGSIKSTGSLIDGLIQQNNALETMRKVSAYGGERCFKALVHRAIDRFAQTHRVHIESMEKKHVERFAEFCANRMQNAFKTDSLSMGSEFAHLGIEYHLIAAIYQRTEKLDRFQIRETRFRYKDDNKKSHFITETTFEGLFRHVGFEYEKDGEKEVYEVPSNAVYSNNNQPGKYPYYPPCKNPPLSQAFVQHIGREPVDTLTPRM